MAPTNTPSANWKSIIQESRNYVPIIEGAEHLGSGLLISTDGLIVTNAHVVEGSGHLFVSLYDGTRAKATTVHCHDESDLAIVRASIHTDQCFEFSSDSIADNCEAGDDALAIGHPRGLSFTATTGIVSETKRTLPDGIFVQTDVAINPGNSGGPLFDSAGKLIGINTQKFEDSQGLGFAIPAHEVLEYWLEFKRKYASGEITIPTDEQLSQMEQSLSPRKVIESASELAEISLREHRHDGDYLWWKAKTASGNDFAVFINEDSFSLYRFIADLEYIPDEQLLFQLLRWQDDMFGLIRFSIDDENVLSLGGGREFKNLDVSEAAMALVRMEEATDLYARRLEGLLEDDLLDY